MELTVKTTSIKKVALYLDEELAVWLKGVMQNPLDGQSLDDEREVDTVCRHLIFNGLKDNDI